jgi:hypothetical protein
MSDPVTPVAPSWRSPPPQRQQVRGHTPLWQHRRTGGCSHGHRRLVHGRRRVDQQPPLRQRRLLLIGRGWFRAAVWRRNGTDDQQRNEGNNQEKLHG